MVGYCVDTFYSPGGRCYVHDQLQRHVVSSLVAEALLKVLEANQNLRYLCFTYCSITFDWRKYTKKILQAMTENRGLCNVHMDGEVERCGTIRKYPISVDPEIDRLFLEYNRFSRFTQEPQNVRQWLIGATLCLHTHNNFQRSAWLLKTNIDCLCEMMQESLRVTTNTIVPDPSMFDDEAVVSPSSLKRSIQRQVSPAAKKRFHRA